MSEESTNTYIPAEETIEGRARTALRLARKIESYWHDRGHTNVKAYATAVEIKRHDDKRGHMELNFVIKTENVPLK